MLDIYEFDSGVEGEHFLVLGAVHGNEVCGPEALSKIVTKFENKDIVLQCGRVTFVPICNPEAYAQDMRYVVRDLNRSMFPIEKPVSYVDHLTNALCPLLESADVLLDLHSYRAGGVPFVFIQGSDAPEVPFAKALGAEHMVYGFANARQQASGVDPEKAKLEAMGTTEYMRLFGGYGVSLECGGNGSLQSVEVAEESVYNALKYLGMIEGHPVICTDPNIVEIDSVCSRPEGAILVCDSFNFAALVKGDVIARSAQNDPVLVAQQDSIIVLPKTQARSGQEWFYLGHRKYG